MKEEGDDEAHGTGVRVLIVTWQAGRSFCTITLNRVQ